MNQRNTTKEHGNAMIDLNPTMETNVEEDNAGLDTIDISEHSVDSIDKELSRSISHP